MSEQPLKILAIGAHPDDCDLTVGGVAVFGTRLAIGCGSSA